MLPIHPRIVHLPLALSVLMPLVAGGLLLAWWRGWLPRRAWAVAVLLQLTLVVGGAIAMNTGERESRRVETVVDEAHVDAHEDAAKLLMAGAVTVLLLAAVALFLRGERAARAVAAVAVAGTLAVLGLAIRVGDRGGRLVYVYGAARVYTGGGGAPGVPGAVQVPVKHHDEDD